MPEIKPASIDIKISSKGRKHKEFWVTQRYSGGWLFLDGKKVKKTKKGDTYLIHLVNGKIDHFETFSPEDWSDCEIESWLDCPEEWCDACAEVETIYPGDDDDIPF
jgi:hypothetical protein